MANATQMQIGNGSAMQVRDLTAWAGDKRASLFDMTFGKQEWDFVQLNDGNVIHGWTNGAINPCGIGDTISFGSQSDMRHFYIDVQEGDIIKVRLRKPAYTSNSSCIVYTDSNGVVILPLEVTDGVQTQVDTMYAAPAGATRMYVMTQDSGGTNTGYTRVDKAFSKNVFEANNLAGEIQAGYWTDVSMATLGGRAQNYKSIKQYLPAGEYTITFGTTVSIIRVIIDGTFCDQTIPIVAGGSYSFRCMKSMVAGFSFVQTSGSSETAWTTWVQLESTGVTLGKHGTTAIDVERRKKALDGEKPLVAKTVSGKDLLNGYWSGGNTYTKAANRLTTFNFIPVHKGDVALFVNKDIVLAFSVFDANRNLLYGTQYISPGYFAESATQADLYVFEADGYMSFNMWDRVKGGSVALSRDDYGDILLVVDTANIVENFSNYTQRAMLGNMRARRYYATIQGQDGCIIGNKLYSFGDGASTPGTINIIDLGTMMNDGTGSHLLGHSNSVDYSPETDALITYASDGTYPAIRLYQHPDFSSLLSPSDPGCVTISLHNSGGTMNGSAAVCFGEAPNIAYFMEGVYTTGTIVNPVRNIYKILLGMGSNDLSASGYGTFISGKADNEYNGTCKVIKTYTGEIIPGLHCFSNANSLWTVQGMQFNGFLYVAYGTAGNNNLKIALNDNAGKYVVVDNLHFEVLDLDGTVIKCEPEMLAFKNGKMYCGVSNRATHDNYLYEIEM